MRDVSTRVLLTVGLGVIAVGAVDAFISREWDLLAVFALAGLVQLTIWLRERPNRRPVTLRADLAHWLERRAQESGEPFDDVLDRSVAWYKHGLYARDSEH